MISEETIKSAYDAIPHLVHHAQMRRLLTYGEIAAKVDRHHRAAQWFLWHIRDEICIPRGVPLLTAIVVNKETGLAGPGWSSEDVSRLSDAEYRLKWEAECERVFAYDGWDGLLQELGLSPVESQVVPEGEGEKEVRGGEDKVVMVPLERVNKRLRAIVAGATQGEPFWARGVASGVERTRHGQVRFQLQDGEYGLACVVLGHMVGELPFEVADGQALMVRGQVEVDARWGELQLVALSLRSWVRG